VNVLIRNNALSEEDFKYCKDTALQGLIDGGDLQTLDRDATRFKKRWYPQLGHPLAQKIGQMITSDVIKEAVKGFPDLAWKWLILGRARQFELQITEYSDKGDFYSWHVDHLECPDWDCWRILNFVLWLEIPEEGGELEVSSNYNLIEDVTIGVDYPIGVTIKPEPNKLAIMPSWMVHRVKPLIKGKRVTINGHIGLT